MERNEQLHEEAEETLDQINKKTGRNMPQAIATGAALVILIVACLLLSVDLFVLLVVMFMILALWELRVDFATVGLHLPVFMLWLCSSFTLIATYYSPYHLITMSLSIIVSIILVAIAASAKISVGHPPEQGGGAGPVPTPRHPAPPHPGLLFFIDWSTTVFYTTGCSSSSSDVYKRHGN